MCARQNPFAGNVDLKYARVSALFARVRARISEIQAKLFAKETESADVLSKLDQFLALSTVAPGSGPALESLARLEDPTMRFIELRGWAPFSRTEQPLAS